MYDPQHHCGNFFRKMNTLTRYVIVLNNNNKSFSISCLVLLILSSLRFGVCVCVCMDIVNFYSVWMFLCSIYTHILIHAQKTPTNSDETKKSDEHSKFQWKYKKKYEQFCWMAMIFVFVFSHNSLNVGCVAVIQEHSNAYLLQDPNYSP